MFDPEILQCYGLDSIQSVESTGSGFLNPVWKVHTGQKVLAVKWHRQPNRLGFTALADLLQHLKQQGVCCETLYHTSMGQPAAEVKGKTYTLSNWIPGEVHAHLPPSHPQTIQAFQALAHMHKSTLEQPFLAFADGWQLDASALLEINREQGLLPMTELKTLVELHHQIKDRLFSSLLPQCVVHGDYRLPNLVFNPQGTGIIDWDFACWAPRILDVAGELVLKCELHQAGAARSLVQHYALAAQQAGCPLLHSEHSLLNLAAQLTVLHRWFFLSLELSIRPPAPSAGDTSFRPLISRRVAEGHTLLRRLQTQTLWPGSLFTS